MAGIDGLVQQAINDLYKKSASDIIKDLQGYQSRIQKAQAKIEAFKKIKESGLLSGDFINWDKSNEEFYKGEAKATSILEEDTYRIAYGKALLDGYHILTELGSYVRQSEEIKYSVTATGLKNMGTYKITWTDMPFEQFAKLVNFNIDQYTATDNNKKYNNNTAVIGGLRLKGVANLFKQTLDKQNLLPDEERVNIYSWDSDQINLYNQFVSRAKTINNIQWSDVNEGNLLEAFTRFQKSAEGKNFIGKKGGLLATANKQILKAMKETMDHPKAFYKGGDIKNLQLKGNQATIADSSTIENMLDSVGQSLNKITSSLPNLSQEASTQSFISLNLEKAILDGVNQEVKKLISQFF